MTTPAVIYAAKSTKDKHDSIGGQLTDGRAMAEREGWEVAGEFSDEAASAYSGDRGPALAEAKELAARLAQEHGGCVLVVQHTDRLARGDAIKAAHLVEHYLWALKAGVKLRSVQDDHNLDDMLRAVLIGERNHEDSARKAQAVAAGMKRRAERGQHNGGHAPYGYEYPRDASGRSIPDLPLEVVPYEAAVIRRIYDEYAAGRSQQSIARALNADGINTKQGGSWHQSQIANYLGQPLYKGAIRFNGEVRRGGHEAIVPEDLWGRVEALRSASAKSKGKGRGRLPKGGHLFIKGFLRCGCGEAMVPVTQPTRTGGTYEVYQCYGRKRHGSDFCSQPVVQRAEVDEAVATYFEAACLDLEATRAEIVQSMAGEVRDVRTMREAAEREEREAAERLARVKRDYTDGKIDADDWREFRTDLTGEREAAQAKLKQLRRREVEVTGQDFSDAETLRYVTELRRAIVGHVQDAEGVDAVRAALIRLFECFTLREHTDAPEPGPRELSHPHLMGVGPACRYKLVPKVRDDAQPLSVALARAVNNEQNGFARWSSAPRAKLRTRSASPERPLRTITGTSGSMREASPSADRTRSSSASPLPSPSSRSRITSCGLRTSSARSPSPSPPAVATSKPSAVRLSARNVAVVSSSSTTSSEVGLSMPMEADPAAVSPPCVQVTLHRVRGERIRAYDADAPGR